MICLYFPVHTKQGFQNPTAETRNNSCSELATAPLWQSKASKHTGHNVNSQFLYLCGRLIPWRSTSFCCFCPDDQLKLTVEFFIQVLNKVVQICLICRYTFFNEIQYNEKWMRQEIQLAWTKNNLWWGTFQFAEVTHKVQPLMALLLNWYPENHKYSIL